MNTRLLLRKKDGKGPFSSPRERPEPMRQGGKKGGPPLGKKKKKEKIDEGLPISRGGKEGGKPGREKG